MLVAFDASGNRALAYETQREAGPFSCTGCGGRACLKKGAWKSPHFAHVPGERVDCDKLAESEQHEAIKREIYEAALGTPGIQFAAMEHRTHGRIADVVLEGRRRRVAVEIQLSPISAEELNERTQAHFEAGYATLWVVDLGISPDEVRARVRYRVPAMVRDLHSIDGFVFVHHAGLQFHVAHLMGWKHVTRKMIFYSRRPVHLFETIDENGFVRPPASVMWWKAKPSADLSPCLTSPMMK